MTALVGGNKSGKKCALQAVLLGMSILQAALRSIHHNGTEIVRRKDSANFTVPLVGLVVGKPSPYGLFRRATVTMVHERTLSVVQTRDFLRDLSMDSSLPEPIRLQAERLLRHYPEAADIWLAGKLEERRREELSHLADKHGPLHSALGCWLAAEPLFCGENSKSSSTTEIN